MGSGPKDAPGAGRERENESYRFSLLHSRCKDAERRLKTAQAAAAVLRSKQAAAAKREEFLLEELAKTNEHLLCKQAPSPRVLCLRCAFF